MPEFYPEAIEAALKISGRSLPLPKEADLDSWPQVFEQLHKLTPAERCDAVYADYVLQLTAPGGKTQLQIRDLLLGQGALAANYLAELAQNADDAADAEDAKLCVSFQSPWLIVGNNGKMVDPGNLIGLCRFFIHWGKDGNSSVQKLDQQTIGKFGIGFKSCYRVAREVLVYSWNGSKDKFAFRLPVTKEGDATSGANLQKWGSICSTLNSKNKKVSLPAEQLGYCTPEFLDPQSYPEVLQQGMELCDWPRGTLFCFNLHPQGQKEIKDRIQIGAEGLYELCPLFLPHIREITLNKYRMSFAKTRSVTKDAGGLPIKAQRATLTNSNEGKNSHDRYWLLSGTAPDDKWTLAVPTDSEYKVRIEPHTDGGIHLRSGGAYAFFPLNAVNETWSNCIRLHLHIDLPTNLARSDWNEGEKSQVENAITSAAKGLVSWISHKPENLHQTFTVQDLFSQIPASSARWASFFYNSFREVANQTAVFRSLDGTNHSAQDIRVIPLRAFSDVQNAVKRIGDLMSQKKLSHSCMFGWDSSDWNLPKLAPAHLRTVVEEMTAVIGNTIEQKIDLARIILAVVKLSSGELEKLLQCILVDKSDQSTLPLTELLGKIGGASLHPSWHAFFRSISNWGDPGLLNLHIKGQHLGGRLKDLSEAKKTLEWQNIASEMSTQQAWIQDGDLFWNSAKTPCPPNLAETVVSYLHIKLKQGTWESLGSKWLLDSNPCQCFLGLISKGYSIQTSEMKCYEEKLNQWGLWNAYLGLIEARISTLGHYLAEKLHKEPTAVFSSIKHTAFDTTLNKLNPANKTLVEQQVKEALNAFLKAKLGDFKTRKFYQQGNIEFQTKSVLEFLGYARAPEWLNDEAQAVLKRFEVVPNDLLIIKAPFTEDIRNSLGKEVLLNAWKLSNTDAPRNEDLEYCKFLFQSATGNWEVALANNRKVHLRDCVAINSKDQTLVELLEMNQRNFEEFKNRLPGQLVDVPRIREIAASSDNISIRILDQENSRSITIRQIDAKLAENPVVQSILSRGEAVDVRYLNPLNIEITAHQGVLMSISKARYAVDGKSLYVSKAEVASDQSYATLVHTYLATRANDLDVSEQLENKVPADQIYNRYRSRILQVFRKNLIEDVGYRREHILRELLQNAESAYASDGRKYSAEKSFALEALPIAGTRKFIITATHYGRRFNGQDTQGKERDDIKRIISIGNEEGIRVAGEIGRFNKGFKSLFYITDCVAIRSGQFDFLIRDLLLLEPSNPKPIEADVESTTFTFECTSTDLQKMTGKAGALGNLHPCHLVFLNEIQRIEISADGHKNCWTLTRSEWIEGWIETRIQTNEKDSFKFAVKHFDTGSVAVQFDEKRHPVCIKRELNFLCLTFPSESTGFGNFLLNGYFDTDPGRISLALNGNTSAILSRALDYLRELCETSLSALQGVELLDAWLKWAEFLSPTSLTSEINERLGAFVRSAHLPVEHIQNWFENQVPHAGEMVALDDLIFPNQTMRKLRQSMGDDFPDDYIDQWSDPAVQECLKKHVTRNLNELTVPNWVEEQTLSDDQQATLITELNQMLAQEKNPVLRNEIESALHKLQPNQFNPPPQITPLDELIQWWKDNEDSDAYTIDGDWHELIVDEGSVKDALRNPTSVEGRLAWYRFLSIASLLSAGRRVTEIKNFLRGNQCIGKIWSANDDKSFLAGCNEVFKQIVDNPPNNVNAGEEYAYLWRRVFYDLRKMHYIVHQCDFGVSMLELCNRSIPVNQILEFARGGRVPGGERWSGVIGQSAGITLLFVIRELRRLDLYKPQEDHHCYFLCRPMRLAAARFGLIPEDSVQETDINRLLDLTQQIHKQILDNDKARKAFANYYDIPFLHYAQEVMK